MQKEDFSKAKWRVFETAVGLFAQSSFESVTLEDIASALDRKKPSIYNHFSSKQEILDTMYDFFAAHLCDERKTLEELRPIFETGSVLDMMLSLLFPFNLKYMDIMSGSLTVIHQRKYFDPRARRIVRELMLEEGIRYVEEAFDYAVSIGRLAPFNTHWIALVLNDTRNGEYLRSVLDPKLNRQVYLSQEELVVFQHAAAVITDLRPPFEQQKGL